jgi:hypothetical protein
MPPREPRRYPLLGLVAYALVPGERRARAATHFRRAGLEVFKGVGALVIPERKGGGAASGRERIELD